MEIRREPGYRRGYEGSELPGDRASYLLAGCCRLTSFHHAGDRKRLASVKPFRSSLTPKAKPMDTDQTLTTFVEFYRERGHHLIASSSLLPPTGDDSVLFTTSGMHPLTPYLKGLPHPHGTRLVNVQRCLRTTDLDEVGDQTHLTLFEMLGSWSLGDYPGPQSLRWGYELLCDGFGVDPSRLHATVFGGDSQVGPDTQALSTWQELGVPVEVTGPENWWSNGPTGPCGPDSEIFGWIGDGPPQGTPGTDQRWMELWNHVTMRYRRHQDGRLEPLLQSHVDTGLGLERLMMFLQQRPSVHEGDVFEPWRRGVLDLWDLDEHTVRVVCDHLRAAVVMIGDGVRPSNTGRGYVLRRLIRRVLTHLWRVDRSRTLVDLLIEPIERTMRHFGQEPDVDGVRELLLSEEQRFATLVTRGRPLVERMRRRGPLGEQDFEYLSETHGLPRELVSSLLEEALGAPRA
jgi:alanyl-tRNA synthetase